MALNDPGLDTIRKFYKPAYTYTIKLPFPQWREEENRLQRTFSHQNAELFNTDSLAETIPDQTDGEIHKAFLSDFGPDKTFHATFTNAAYRAVQRFFSNKQATADPTFDCYCQSELGNEHLHVHIVIGGPGLSKYNAKPACGIIAYHFFNNLISYIESITDVSYNPYPAYNWIMKDARQQCIAGCSDRFISILQYKTKYGDTHACRVDAGEYICNYLLCKNLKYHTSIDPKKATPFFSYFESTDGTYAHTSINGESVPPERRKFWVCQLQQTAACNQVEPVFRGDLFGALPKVQSTWQPSSSRVTVNKLNKKEGLVLDCLTRCYSNNLLTYEDMVESCPELLVMMESQTGGNKLIQQALNMLHIKITQKHTALSFIKERYTAQPLTSNNRAIKLIVQQGYNLWQAGHWLCCVLNKTAGKQNTCSFYGPASTGKTNMAKALVNTVKLYGCINHQNKNFIFNDCAAKLIVWWEEALMHMEWVEQAKCVLGGTTFRIDKKHSESMLLPQTPVIISTNNDIYTVVGGNVVTGVHAKPIRERVVQFNFMKMLDPTFGEITEQEIADWLLTCEQKYDCTLEEFLREWDLDKVPNDFPLAKPCSSCSQDYTLHDCGLCYACGTFLPLDTHDRGDRLSPIPTSSEQSPSKLFPSPFKMISPSKIHFWAMNFDLSHLETPKSRKRAIESPTPSTSTGSSTASTSATVRKQLRFTDSSDDEDDGLIEKARKILDKWGSQPQDESEEREHEEDMASLLEETGQRPGLTPSEWGERLGVINQGAEKEPIVLHCFESMPQSDEEESDGHL